MAKTITRAEQKTAAHSAGWWYLGFAVFTAIGLLLAGKHGVIDFMNVDSQIKIGIIAALLGLFCYLKVGHKLFKLFRSTSATLAWLMVILIIAGVAVSLIGSLGAGYDFGSIANLFWGLWLFPLAALIFKSELMPRGIGVILIITGICNLCIFASAYLFRDFFSEWGSILSLIALAGEVIFLFYLLIIGVKNRN